MPHVATVMRWLAQEEHESFREQYARACELRADAIADEILAIADDASRDVVEVEVGEDSTVERERFTATARDKLKIDSRKWLLGKLAPKKYGDKVDVTTGGEKLPGVPVIQIIAPA
ncbi:hypothetical protein MUN82_08820 [Hymenobacter aerilatus]|uniref:Terminase small subunit protein n=2 Tax=Hymenobacter aerilatus TaxID=2932251 RepID=A0A8T9SZ96_9BACT|nr:hypothetical protein [Hymenobacter aerilatus]UOR07185.1 hypothetical protein MUN82_08820 [Hymenobacter aerilatus]